MHGSEAGADLNDPFIEATYRGIEIREQLHLVTVGNAQQRILVAI